MGSCERNATTEDKQNHRVLVTAATGTTVDVFSKTAKRWIRARVVEQREGTITIEYKLRGQPSRKTIRWPPAPVSRAADAGCAGRLERTLAADKRRDQKSRKAAAALLCGGHVAQDDLPMTTCPEKRSAHDDLPTLLQKAARSKTEPPEVQVPKGSSLEMPKPTTSVWARIARRFSTV